MQSRILLTIVLVTLMVSAGCGAPVNPTGTTDTQTPAATNNGSLTARWVSDTARNISGNHHAPVAGRVQDQPLVFAPISGKGNTKQCELVTLNGANGSVRWQYQIPPANCTIHSVADSTLADIDGDGTQEVIAATTERVVAVYNPLTGEQELHHNLSSYGYTKPLVANVTGDGQPELIVVDVKGSVFVVRPNGTAVWSRIHTTYTWGQPALADFDADRSPELAVALGNGQLYMYNAANRTVRWNCSLSVDGSITWVTHGQADDDPARELAAATDKGRVLLFDGRDGSIQWRANFSAFAAVHVLGDGDGDGTAEVYVTARDGKVRSLNATTGAVEWTTTLTTENVQMTPPPTLGDVDGDGTPELVTVTNNGIVTVVDPASRAKLPTYQ